MELKSTMKEHNLQSSKLELPTEESPTSTSTFDSTPQHLMRDLEMCPPLHPMSFPKSIRDVQYAVRGRVVQRSMELAKEKNLPFKKLLPCHIGNPMAVGMQPLTYTRQLLSLVSYKDILSMPDEFLAQAYAPDIVARAKKYLNALKEVGAYSHSQGADGLREEIANFFERRDVSEMVRADVARPKIETIFMTNGASDAIDTILTCVISGPKDGIMVPCPQYPLYAATITKLRGTAVFYELDESNEWSFNRAELERSHEAAVATGIEVRCVCVISPGNPAPMLLNEAQIRDILEFADEKNLLVIADEVYQENIYKNDASFISFRSVLLKMRCEREIENAKQITVQLASLHSASKGFYGECGLRAGVCQFDNVSDEGIAMLYKMRSVGLCSNTIGQCVIAAILNPPVEGEASYETYIKEKAAILTDFKMKAKFTEEKLNDVQGVYCSPINGAMYAFPSVTFSDKAVQFARSKGMSIELFYCLRMLEETGIITTPGDGFGQKENTHHFRMTILPTFDDLKEALNNFQTFHNKFVQTYC